MKKLNKSYEVLSFNPFWVYIHTRLLYFYINFYKWLFIWIPVYQEPIVIQIPSNIKNSIDFLLNQDAIKSVLDKAYLESLDVKPLYTNIINEEWIKAVKEWIDKHTSKNVAKKVITTFLVLALTLNKICVKLQIVSSNKRKCVWYVHHRIQIFSWMTWE